MTGVIVVEVYEKKIIEYSRKFLWNLRDKKS